MFASHFREQVYLDLIRRFHPCLSTFPIQDSHPARFPELTDPGIQ